MTTYTLGDPSLPGALQRPAVTLGVFDGVHRGHSALLHALTDAARASGADPVAVTFDPHPRHVLTDQGPPLLLPLERRCELLLQHGLRAVVVLPFDRDVAQWSPEDFVQRVFVEGLGASHIVLGRDHRFGHARRGDLDLLTSLGRTHDFGVTGVDLRTLDDQGQVISSTAIRNALRDDHLARAAVMLGRPVEVTGDVVQGDQRGRTLGFPTANLDLAHTCRPARGVYAATVTPAGRDLAWPAVVNIGRRPTFHPEANQDLVEVHLLDQHLDLYGQRLRTTFLAKLRDERPFDGPDALKAQIDRDIAAARNLLPPHA